MAYQSIYYDYKEKEYYLRDDKKSWSCFKYYPTYYKLNPEGEYETLFGDRCSPINGKFDWNDPEILGKDIDKELLVLRDLYYETDEIPSFHNIVFLDIEIEQIGTLTPETIRNADAEITAISLLDNNSKTKICFILDKNEDLEDLSLDNKFIYSCKSEKELINKFLDIWGELDPTICVHFNGDFFDIPYLFYRIKRILGDEVYKLSPIRKINENIFQPESPIKIGGVNCLDFMLLLKKYIMKEEPSYKLGDIGTKYVDLGKIQYSGNLNKLFKEDKQKFIEYNIRDVEILEALENKLKFVQLTILISHLCHTPYESIYFNTVLNDGAILTYLKRKNIIPPNKPTTTNPEIKELNIGDDIKNQRGTPSLEGVIVAIDKDIAKIKTSSGKLVFRNIKTIRKNESYAGGFLLDPIPGLYEDLIDLDYTSLYPSIIKSLNLGIETLVGNIVTENNYEQNLSLDKLKEKDGDQIVKIQKIDKKTFKLKKGTTTIKKLIELIETNNYTISASGAIFRTDIKSIAVEVLEDWFEKREYYRELKKQAGKQEKWDDFQFYDLYQMAFKILQNAKYGGYAINSWRFTDGYKICSSAITNSGQRLDKSVIEFCNNKINKELNSNKNYVVAADTDSAFIEIKDIINHRFKNLSPQEKEKQILKIAEELQNESNENLTKICKSYFNLNENKYFQLKQEVIISRAYWAGKRRYAMWITNKEGVPIPDNHKDALDMKGLDIMKSNMTPLFKSFGKQLLIDILHGKPKQHIDKSLIDFKNYLNTLPYDKLAKPSGVKKITEYIHSPPLPGEMFSRLGKKCPINTKAAIYYNDIIRFKKLEKQYPEFIEGDKILFTPLKSNPYGIEVLGFRGNNEDPEFIRELLDKYSNKIQSFESVFLNKLENIYKDLKWEFPSFNKNASLFFKF